MSRPSSLSRPERSPSLARLGLVLPRDHGHPSVPADAKPIARSTAESRYKQFVEHVVQQFSGGRRFLDDLPREVVADHVELTAIVERSVGSAGTPDTQ